MKGSSMKAKIINKIQQSANRFIPFDQFMEMALYDSEAGYYTKSQTKIGKEGDFYTSVSASPIFAEIIAKWIIEQVKSGIPPYIVELGGGTGELAQTIMQKLQNDLQHFHYVIVESSPFHQSLIRTKLPTVEIIPSLDQLPEFAGIVISNEFFDALPVKAVIFQNGQWHELGVTVENNDLQETAILADQSLIEMIKRLGITAPHNHQRLELPLVMNQVYNTLCHKIGHGVILTIDYGMKNESLLLPERKQGSIRGFYQHQLIDNIYQNPGQIDITSNVLFDELIRIGEAVHFETMSFTSQRQFLLDQNIFSLLEEHRDTDPFSHASKRNRAIMQFIIGDFSQYFHTLIQRK